MEQSLVKLWNTEFGSRGKSIFNMYSVALFNKNLGMKLETIELGCKCHFK